MNRLINDDYLRLQDYPEHITNTIRSGHSTCVRFNRKGDYLASGRVDGTVVIWDLDTMGVARKLRGHAKSVSSLSWSPCGRYLLSTSHACDAILWRLQDGSRYRTVGFRYNAPVFAAELHPLHHHEFVVCLMDHHPYLVDTTSRPCQKHALPSVPPNQTSAEPEGARHQKREMTTAIVYTPTGNHILSGTNKGRLNIIDAKTHDIIFSEKVTNSVITTIRMLPSGKAFAVNSKDLMRTFLLPPNLDSEGLDPDTLQIPLLQKFKNMVSQGAFNHVAFSGTSEYVAASTYDSHDFLIFDVNRASLLCMLDPPKEEQCMIDWHPWKPMIAACGLETGRIYIYSVTSPQKWSALAPDFVEIEENVSYVEREDEFDIHPQEEITKRRLDQEDEDVDVLGGLEGFVRDDEFRMPILFNLGESDSEAECVKSEHGALRRKSPEGEAEGEERVVSKPASGGRRRSRKR